MKNLTPHQQRAVDEKTELDGRIGRLNKFILSSPYYQSLCSTEQLLLLKQQRVMEQYSNILAERIDGFKHQKLLTTNCD